MNWKVAFRIDDVTHTMNWEKFNSFCCLFDKYGIKPLLGVIPDNHDSSLRIDTPRLRFWDDIRALSAKGYVIAQHGYQHVYHTSFAGILGINAYSEFVGLSYLEQLDKITAGKKILDDEGLSSQIWMAPAHSYDYNTLSALTAAGFKYISDGYALFPYTKYGLKFLPCQVARPFSILRFGFYTICIHPNCSTCKYLQLLEQFISEFRKHCLNYTEVLCLPSNDLWFNIASEYCFKNLRKVKHIFWR